MRNALAAGTAASNAECLIRDAELKGRLLVAWQIWE